MCPSSQAAGQRADDEAAIRSVMVAMTTAFNTRDEEATTNLMTADADFVNVLVFNRTVGLRDTRGKIEKAAG